MVRKQLLIVITALSMGFASHGQCTIEILQADTTVCKNEIVTLTATGQCGVIMENDFNNGTIGIGWSSNASPMLNNPCPPTLPPASGITCWIGSASSWPRQMTTIGFDISNNTSCVIDFDMKYGDIQSSSNCEDPDLPDEGVHLQYSTNGFYWTNINYWPPNSNISGPLYTWNHYTETMPIPAYSPGTQIRWWQDVTSGNGFDHWGIDNVKISCDPGQISYQWWSTGDTSSTIQISATQSSVYVASITNMINSATDSVYVNVYPYPVDPLGTDTVICKNHSIQFQSPQNTSAWQWSDGSITNSITLDSSYLAADSVVWIEFTDSLGCTLKDSIIVLLDDCAGIQEEAMGLQIYPQPSDGQIIISWPGHPIEAIQLFDLNGNLIEYEAKSNAAENTYIQFNTGSSGTYILHISSGETTVRRKITQITK